MPDFSSPASMSIHEESTIAASIPLMRVMPMMGQGMGQMAATMARHVEGRIAFRKTELKITDAQQAHQQAQWNAVADAMRANAETVAETAGGVTAAKAICRCPSRSKARSWPRNRRNLANVGSNIAVILPMKLPAA